MAVYLDSSALVKLVITEAESAALLAYLREHPVRVSAALARVEVLRAVRAHGPPALERARQLLNRLVMLKLDDDLLTSAASLDPAVLRSLDAMHLAAAARLGTDLEAVVTYDSRMRDAARIAGLTTIAPS